MTLVPVYLISMQSVHPGHQDVVEERFQKEYLIAIGIAAVIVSVLTTVIVILVAIKCRGLKKSRRRSYEDAKIHLYQNSAR